MVKAKISPLGDMTGWTFKQWFIGNWKTVKEVIKVGVPFLIGMLVSPNPALISLITVAGKLLMDSGEYFFSTITLPKK